MSNCRLVPQTSVDQTSLQGLCADKPPIKIDNHSNYPNPLQTNPASTDRVFSSVCSYQIKTDWLTTRNHVNRRPRQPAARSRNNKKNARKTRQNPAKASCSAHPSMIDRFHFLPATLAIQPCVRSLSQEAACSVEI